jgi:hypothetical protein
MNKFYIRGIGIFTLALLTACQVQPPVGPSPGVTAGPGKSDADFMADVNACKAVAAAAVKDVVKATNQQLAMGVAANMAAGSTAGDAAKSGLAATQDAQGSVQQQYDAAYGPCMFERGDNVPGMERAPPPPVVVEPHVVMRDPLVMQVQQALVKLGYLHSSPDGVAGKKTAAAISQFETDKGMTVDGVSSRNLLAALKAAEAGGGAMPPPPAAGGAMPPPPAGAMPPPPAK